jgi:hypothetical protein
MAYRCANQDCAFAETGVCARKAEFADPPLQCVDLQEGKRRAAALSPPNPSPESNLHERRASDFNGSEAAKSGEAGRFWSGLALGSDEAGWLLGDPRTRLFTVIGGQNRGKTCLLTAFYIQLANGFTADFPWNFCGSRSLDGFQRLANPAFDWEGGEERIVPRTTHSSFRQPSFLHLALKRRTHARTRALHVLLTDMPGEWFERWMDVGSQGFSETLEFMPRSDAFMVMLDAPKLLVDRNYKNDQEYLLARLVEFNRQFGGVHRPIALVLTKYDQIAKEVPIPPVEARNNPDLWGSLRSPLGSMTRVLKDLPEAIPWKIFPCAAFSRPSALPVGVLAPFDFLLEQTSKFQTPLPTSSQPRFNGRFLSMFREGGEE